MIIIVMDIDIIYSYKCKTNHLIRYITFIVFRKGPNNLHHQKQNVVKGEMFGQIQGNKTRK